MKKRFIFISILIILAFAMIYNYSNLTYASPIEFIDNQDKIDGGIGYSSNWAGYIAIKKDSNGFPISDSVSYIKGSWTVPEVDCSLVKNGNTFIWVGIDGYLSSTIEQIGTSSKCVNGNPEYSGWYEFYPQYAIFIPSFTVSPGDNITAEVRYLPKKEKFRLTITNDNTGEKFSVTRKSNNAQRSSAEWIIEAPKESDNIVPLSDFGEVTFRNAEVKIKGKMGKIESETWANRQIDMFYQNGLKANTSSLSESGDSFSVTWLHE